MEAGHQKGQAMIRGWDLQPYSPSFNFSIVGREAGNELIIDHAYVKKPS